MKNNLLIIALIIFSSAIGLCLYWFDYKLLIILFLWGWGNNVELKYRNYSKPKSFQERLEEVSQKRKNNL